MQYKYYKETKFKFHFLCVILFHKDSIKFTSSKKPQKKKSLLTRSYIYQDRFKSLFIYLRLLLLLLSVSLEAPLHSVHITLHNVNHMVYTLI